MKDTSVVNVQEALALARSFEKASKLLFSPLDNFKEGEPLVLPVVPAIVLQVFSVEIYLKCLLKIENVEFRKIHAFTKLFARLSVETKEKIANKLQIETAEVLTKLEAYDKAFIQWRYAYEDEKNKKLEYQGRFLNSFKQAIEDLIHLHTNAQLVTAPLHEPTS